MTEAEAGTMPGEKVYPGSNGSATPELSPPPARDFYNISIKDQVYGTAPVVSSYRNEKKRRKCKCRNPCYAGNCNPCRCCWSWLCTLLVLIVVGGVVFYLVVRPKIPDFEVTDFRLTGLDQSLTTQQLTTVSAVTIRSYNGNNRLAFDYKSLQVRVLTQNASVSVGDGSIPPFYQGTGETVNLVGNFKATPMAIGKDTQATLTKAQSTGNLALQVNVDIKARLELASAKFIKLKIKVRCSIAVNPKVTVGSQILNKNCNYKGRPYV